MEWAPLGSPPIGGVQEAFYTLLLDRHTPHVPAQQLSRRLKIRLAEDRAPTGRRGDRTRGCRPSALSPTRSTGGRCCGGVGRRLVQTILHGLPLTQRSQQARRKVFITPVTSLCDVITHFLSLACARLRLLKLEQRAKERMMTNKRRREEPITHTSICVFNR